MSFDDYVNHVAKKLRLATSIAIIKSKPKNLSTIEYIEKLRDNIRSMDYDSDVTVCSDDFDVATDDVTQVFENNDLTQDSKTINDNIHNYNSQKYNDYVSDNEMHNDNVIGQNNIGSQKTNDAENCVNKYGSSNINDVIEVLQELKKIDNTAQEKPHTLPQHPTSNSQTQEFSQDFDSNLTYCESLSSQLNKQNTLGDTQIYSLNDYTPFYTHYSESQVQNLAVQPNMLHRQLNQKDLREYEFSQNGQGSESLNNNKFTCNTDNRTSDIVNDNDNYIINDMHSNINGKNIYNNTNNRAFNVANDKNNYITKFSYDKNTTNIDSKSHANDVIYTNDNYINDIHNNTLDKNIHSNRTTFDAVNDNNKYGITNITLNDTSHSNDVIYANNINDIHTNTNDISKTTNSTTEFGNDANKYYNDNVNSDNVMTHDARNDASDDSNDLTDSQREIISFKVIEELNKIKSYLRRSERRMSCDGSSDSGYRSDSQGRNSRNSLKLSCTTLNQSGHSLLTYINTCSLNTNTYDINKEISRALGSLIDKLHEDEMYPSFLEHLLETISELLRNIYEEDGCNNVLLSKDEKVQRVLLLNKSTHIQKYTIDKITLILETIDTETYEISHTAKMENLCYIFHILETILSKHKTERSQSQESQERVLKKSSITDIWRKKWNLSKEIVVEKVEKKCALTKCSEVLNKLIVNCMEGYSLISFVALKCFNLLQPK